MTDDDVSRALRVLARVGFEGVDRADLEGFALRALDAISEARAPLGWVPCGTPSPDGALRCERPLSHDGTHSVTLTCREDPWDGKRAWIACRVDWGCALPSAMRCPTTFRAGTIKRCVRVSGHEGGCEVNA